MKKSFTCCLILIACVLIISPVRGFAEDTSKEGVPKEDLATLTKFTTALQKGDKETVASLIEYPLVRETPLKDIKDKEEFLKYYEDYFDKETIPQVLKDAKSPWNNWQGTATRNGLIWIEGNFIRTLNVSTKKLEERLKTAKGNDSTTLYASAKGYDKLLVDCKTKKHKIRIQKHGEVYKYFSWNNKKSLSSKPEMELSGSLEIEGSAGNEVYTFKNKEYSYVFYAPHVCSGEEDCSPTLTVSKKEKELSVETCD